MHPLTRRNFLTSATVAVSAAANAVNAQTQVIPIIDTHIHLFDQTRPQGAPYTGNPGNTEPALPQTYRKLAPVGIVGAIEIEASPWVEDNLWVLEVEATDPVMVGYVGNLQPEKPEFAEYLDRYTEIASAQGTETKPTAQLKALGFTALASSVIPLDSARFFHLGSSRQLLESLEQVQRKSLTPVKSFRVSSAKEPATGGERLQTWVEGSQPHTPLSLDGFNLVTGLPFKAEVRHLRADRVLTPTVLSPRSALRAATSPRSREQGRRLPRSVAPPARRRSSRDRPLCCGSSTQGFLRSR